MLKRRREKSGSRKAALAATSAWPDDQNGAATWRRIAEAVLRFANKALPGPVD
jgi:hypothetical protein